MDVDIFVDKQTAPVQSVNLQRHENLLAEDLLDLRRIEGIRLRQDEPHQVVIVAFSELDRAVFPAFDELDQILASLEDRSLSSRLLGRVFVTVLRQESVERLVDASR